MRGEDDAKGWLATERRLVETDTWTTPETRDPRRSAPTTLAAFAAESFGRRRVRGEALRPRTIKLYEGLMARVIGPSPGDRRRRDIRRVDVDRWYAALPPEKVTQRAHAYALLRSIYEQALDEGVVPGPNPCAIRGPGAPSRSVDPLVTDGLISAVTTRRPMASTESVLSRANTWGLRSRAALAGGE